MKLQPNKHFISSSSDEYFMEKFHENFIWNSSCIPTSFDILNSLNNIDTFELSVQWFINILDLHNINQIIVYNKNSYILLGGILYESHHSLSIGLLEESKLQGNIDLNEPALVIDLLIDQGDDACAAILTLKELGLKTIYAAFLVSIKEKNNGIINLNKRGIKTIDTAMEVIL